MIRTASRSRGHTLIELVVSMATASVLMVGLGSAMLIAVRAASPDLPATRGLQGARVLERIEADLRDATSFNEHTQNAVEFTVPDRDDDGQAETIRYEWDATAGSPLEMTYNANAPGVMLDNVHDFSLSYRTVEETRETFEDQSASQLLRSLDSVGSDYNVKHHKWVGQFLIPALPSGTLHWSVDRVEVRLRREHSNEWGYLQIRRANSNRQPEDNVLVEIPINSNGLTGSQAWYSFDIAGVEQLHPDETICIVLLARGSDFPFSAHYVAGGEYESQLDLLETGNDGSSWESTGDKGLRFKLWGRVNTATARTTDSAPYLQQIGVRLQVGETASSAVEGNVHIPSQPEMAP